MHLTRYTDYSLRLLMALGLRPDESMTIQEVSDLYGISRNHLVKIVHHVSALGLIATTRGRKGGIRLAVDPEQVVIGKVIRTVESGLALAECFDSQTDQCVISPVCNLKPMLREALQAFFLVLDRYTLADLLEQRRELLNALMNRQYEPDLLPVVAAAG